MTTDVKNNTTALKRPLKATIETEIVQVTPEMAKAFLAVSAEQHKNRNVNQSWVNTLARDFADGKYIFDGEPFRFNRDGVMVDGQHRCHAIINAGVTVPVLIVRNVDDDAFMVMDTGRVRSVGNMLQINGNINTSQLSSAGRLLWDYEHFLRHGKSRTYRETPSKATVFRFIESRPDIVECVNTIHGSAVYRRLFAESPLSVAYYLWREIDREDAATVLERIVTGAELPVDDPCFRAREWAINMRSRLAGKTAQVHRHIQLGLLLKAWNLAREGKTCRLLRLAISETFPVPI